jgi:hypothetical protein
MPIQEAFNISKYLVERVILPLSISQRSFPTESYFRVMLLLKEVIFFDVTYHIKPVSHSKEKALACLLQPFADQFLYK